MVKEFPAGHVIHQIFMLRTWTFTSYFSDIGIITTTHDTLLWSNGMVRMQREQMKKIALDIEIKKKRIICI